MTRTRPTRIAIRGSTPLRRGHCSARTGGSPRGATPATRPPLTGCRGFRALSSTGVSRRAIFVPDGGKPMVLSEGASLDDGKISRIASDHVMFAGPRGDVTLYLAFDHNRTPSQPVLPGGPARVSAAGGDGTNSGKSRQRR